MKIIRTEINNIKPGDVLHQTYCFITLNNEIIFDCSFSCSYKLTLLNTLGQVIVIICSDDQQYDLLVV